MTSDFTRSPSRRGRSRRARAPAGPPAPGGVPAPPRRPAGRWPAGDHPTQNEVDTGMTRWTAADEPLGDTDVVLRHVFGVHHVPRPAAYRHATPTGGKKN
ncbi:copper amine oxidase [Kineococcus sp. SYSU DK003]|uniref:copper amine oxidase n=1 Tax=Kineococcus sp. SYSU DK003 TaxID=3383124 RepID=UPI003D7C8F1E